MDSETGKLYELKALVLKALAHPLRLAVVDFLADGERCVCEIADHVDAERSNVSRHLALMLRAGILECRRDGLKVLYTLKTPCVLNFLSCATNVLREQVESSRLVLSRL
ncbi:MAG: ArsR/SmtB family transcription factor [Planctomycetota bacterium]